MSILNISVQNWTHENMPDARVHAGVQASQVFKNWYFECTRSKLNTYTDVWCVQIQMFEHASGVKKVLQMLNICHIYKFIGNIWAMLNFSEILKW